MLPLAIANNQDASKQRVNHANLSQVAATTATFPYPSFDGRICRDTVTVATADILFCKFFGLWRHDPLVISITDAIGRSRQATLR